MMWNIWQYNFQKCDWELFTTCTASHLSVMSKTLLETNPHRLITISQEKPAPKFTFG